MLSVSSAQEMARVALEWTVYIVLGITGVLVISIAVYGLGSFALMRAHTARRSFGMSFRELARETILASLTQPFVPLFYLIGHRMEPLFAKAADKAVKGSRVPVVFVHGYMQNRVDFYGLARAFAKRGIGPLYGINYPWFASITSNARRLERYVERVCREANAPAVDLVCHSMGGLVAIEMLHSEAEASAEEGKKAIKVRKLVTIATPHAGVAWRGPIFGVGATSLRRGSKLLETHSGYALKVPTLSVFSSHDNIVHPKETASLLKRGGRDVEVEGFGHLSILFSEAVYEHVASFLVEPGPSKAIVVPDDVRGTDEQVGVRVGEDEQRDQPEHEQLEQPEPELELERERERL